MFSLLTIKSLENEKKHRRAESYNIFNSKEYISKLLNPEYYSKDIPLFKAKQSNLKTFFRKNNLISRSTLNQRSLSKQIRTVPTLKTQYSKKTSAVNTFDKIVSLKSGVKLLQETSQEETNNRGFYAKFYTYEMINAMISLISVLVVVIHFEATFNYEGNDDIFPYNFFLLFLNLLSVMMWINIILYYYDQYKLKILNKNYSKNQKFLGSIMFKRIIIEILFTLVQPCQIFSGYTYTIEASYKKGVKLKRSINAFLSIFVVARVYYIDRFLIFQSSFMSPDNNEICRKHFFNVNIKYALIALLKTKPVHFYFVLVISILFVFQYIIKVFESAVNDQDLPLNKTYNVIWYCLITIFTVGYGDIVARSDGGRMFISILSLIGSFLISLLLMGLTKFLEQSQTEAKQFNLLKRIGLNESRKDKAKQVTNEFLKMVMNNKNIRQSIGELKPNSRSFLNSVKSFEESEKSVERHGDQINDYPFDNVGFAFRYFDKEYQKLIDEDKNTISEMGGMLESLEQLNEQLNE